MSEETYTKCIKPDGEFKGKRVGPKDIIRLQTGGTGYAARDGEKAQVKKHFSLGERGGVAGWRQCSVVLDSRWHALPATACVAVAALAGRPSMPHHHAPLGVELRRVGAMIQLLLP